GRSRDLCVSRVQPAGGANQPIQSDRRFPRSRSQRHPRRENFDRNSGLQRLGTCASQNRQTVSYRRTVGGLTFVERLEDSGRSLINTSLQRGASEERRVETALAVLSRAMNNFGTPLKQGVNDNHD